jgi:hypothetical protein
MAKVIVSGNLNQYGDVGRFETDRSTWGFADAALVRSPTQKYSGLYSALKTKNFTGDGHTLLVPCKWLSEAGKNYLLRVRVRVPSGLPIGGDTVEINMDAGDDNLFWPGTPIDITNKTVLQATDVWVEVTASVEGASAGAFGGYAYVNLRTDVNGIDGGQIYVDQFEIFEYINDDEGGGGGLPVDEVFFSRNPVTKQVAASSGWELETNYRLYDDVRVEDVTDSDTYVSKLKTALTPAADGNAVFQVREAFRGVLAAVPPTLNQATIERLTDRAKRFKHFTGELVDDEVTPGSLTESDAALVILGGLNKYTWPGFNFFSSWLPVHKMFMTWAPIEKEVDRTQEDYLNYFVFDTDMLTLNLLVKAYFDDNTNQTATIASKVVSYQQLYQLPAGPVNAGVLLINPAKTVIKYEVWVTDQADAVQSEVRTYIIDPVSDPRKRFFLFLNSLGSYEVLRFTAQAEFTTEFVKDGIVKFLPYNYAALDGEKEINNATLQESGSYGSGYLNSALSREWLDYLKDFLLSRRVYDVTDGKRRPVSIPGGSFNTGGDQNYERAIRFTLLDSYADENYTPKL